MASVASSCLLLQGLCHTGSGGTTNQGVGVPGVFYDHLFLNRSWFFFSFYHFFIHAPVAKSTVVCAVGTGGVTRCGVTLCFVKPLCSFPSISCGWASQCSRNLLWEGPELQNWAGECPALVHTAQGLQLTRGLAAEVGSSALSVQCSAWAAPKSAPQLLQLVMQLCKESCHLFLSDDLSGNTANTVPVYIQGSSQQGKNFHFTVFNSTSMWTFLAMTVTYNLTDVLLV